MIEIYLVLCLGLGQVISAVKWNLIRSRFVKCSGSGERDSRKVSYSYELPLKMNEYV